MPLQYLNIYIIFFVGSIVAVFAGVGLCYTGLSELEFNVYRGMELTTYFLDKNRYDLYLNGLVYCITFGAALLLLLAVILIPVCYIRLSHTLKSPTCLPRTSWVIRILLQLRLGLSVDCWRTVDP